MPIKIEKDFSGAIRKTQAAKNVPVVFKRGVTEWAAETVRELKRSAALRQRSAQFGGKKTGQMGRNVGMQIAGSENEYKVAVGTGVGGTETVKYASIQDEGGVITKKNKMLTIPIGGVQGTIKNYPGGFFIKSRQGNVLYVVRKWAKDRGGASYHQTSGLIPLFLLRNSVTIPASHWFSTPMAWRLQVLEEYAKPENLMRIAEMMV
jgi:hypothetical protein